MDFNDQPYVAVWEETQACDLVCAHCRACAKPMRHPLELSTAEGQHLIDEVAAMQVPVFVLSGGDPLKRPDISRLVEYATMKGVRTSLTPSATPLLTRDAIAGLKRAGLARLAVSLDGANAHSHDAFRGVPGSFELTLQAIRWAHELGMPLQINTTISRRNLGEFEEIASLVEALDVVLWSVFFLVPTGRGQAEDLLSADQFEAVFHRLYGLARLVRFDIKTTEAQHYRRFVAQAQAAERRKRPKAAGARKRPIPPVVRSFGPPPDGGALYPMSTPDGIGRAPRGINDGKGFVFISHLGEVYPSGFLPVSAGNIRAKSLAEIYRHSSLFTGLRDSSNLKGKCGACEFREICGGSRARAYAVTGDVFAEEPWCVYQPQMAAVAA
jgi:radical SAM protein